MLLKNAALRKRVAPVSTSTGLIQTNGYAQVGMNRLHGPTPGSLCGLAIHLGFPPYLDWFRSYAWAPPVTTFLLVLPQPCCFIANLRVSPAPTKRAMLKSTQQSDLSALAKTKHGLVYLTANDWALIADKATRHQFKASEPIVQRGRRTHGIFVLLRGTAAVQLSAEAPPRNIAAGEVCGEISFLDELPATADVVATGVVEAFYLDRPLLQSLIELYPHLGSRFYHSLAAILSRRLREMIAPAITEAPAAIPASKKTSK